ncbi:MAG TPA: primosomal protein N', partial [Pyrinomonadaceae bacterium]|nr:primosomal protein N' [Pyrinomonadaceae bacterium]
MPHTPGSSPQTTAISPAPRENEPKAPLYVEVAVPLHVSQTFTYRLPEAAGELAQVGSRVLVPLGRSAVTGFIVELLPDLGSHRTLTASDIRSVEKVLDATPLVTPEVMEVTRWVSQYYGSPWGEVLKGALPPGISPSSEQLFALTAKGIARLDESGAEEATPEAQVLRAIAHAGELNVDTIAKLVGKREAIRTTRDLQNHELIIPQIRSGPASAGPRTQRIAKLRQPSATEVLPSRKLTKAQQRILDALSNQEAMPLSELLHVAGVSISAVNTLNKHGQLEIVEESVRRDPLGRVSLPHADEYQLTEAQSQVLGEITPQLRSGSYAAFLLHGVTGSGKTEVYMRSMRLCLELGRAAMMLVPEIALTPVFSRRLRSNFGDQVAIFHSSLSKGERFDEWMRVKTGHARIVIGTRSGVFAPIANLGLVIVDEEHESTYRQQDSPRYNGRDTAIVRAQKENAVVILGSATPSLESFHNAQTGKYLYLQLPSRIGDRPMAAARIIDMREVFARHKKPQVFSDELLEAIEITHKKGEQSIILLNRRGYSSFVLCRSCGETIQCPNCDVTLTYHRSERVIVCHYCNHREAAPEKCPACNGKYIYYVGEGTEQIEAMLAKLFPALRIARIDR